ncbi:MAG: DUF2971 domain-containing protein [Phycisphaerae bacterium]|nr:DUF2971 domain-containing protein [Phycisphaerae bacterium]
MNLYHKTSHKSSNPSQESINPTLPKLLYKYCSFNEWTESIFKQNEIYFQSPDCFNDPFDSKISTTYEGTEKQRISRVKDCLRKGIAIGRYKEKPEKELHADAVRIAKAGQDTPLVLRTMKKTAEQMRKEMGIFCMTQKKDDILMWSHYADNHTGFCLEFQTTNDFFRRDRIFNVHYSSERPCLNLIEPPNPEKTVKALLTKAKGWEDEKEWRIIDHKNGPGPKTYPPEALSGVILGCRISPDNRIRITQWCRARKPQPTIYWAEEKDSEFGLDIRLIK